MALSETISSVSELLNNAINKIWPNPEDKAKAEAVVMAATADAVNRQLEAEQKIMLAEAQSADPWTSRARPSFLYVVYVLLLASLPMGVLFAVDADTAQRVTQGFKLWLEAIPEPIISLFGMGYLGYTGARSFEKWKVKR